MRTINVHGTEHDNADDAIQDLYASGVGDYAISIGGKYLTIAKAEARRLESLGVPFAYLFDQEVSGEHRLITVPVN